MPIFAREGSAFQKIMHRIRLVAATDMSAVSYTHLFSEYMALLSGNTDLLDKAKLEKRIASLEGERCV